jgi:hypothetical protein
MEQSIPGSVRGNIYPSAMAGKIIQLDSRRKSFKIIFPGNLYPAAKLFKIKCG